MKVFFRRIHLYLSLAAGLVILVACLTGAMLVFEKEAQMALNKDRYFVEATGQKIPLENGYRCKKTISRCKSKWCKSLRRPRPQCRIECDLKK